MLWLAIRSASFYCVAFNWCYGCENWSWVFLPRWEVRSWWATWPLSRLVFCDLLLLSASFGWFWSLKFLIGRFLFFFGWNRCLKYSLFNMGFNTECDLIRYIWCRNARERDLWFSFCDVLKREWSHRSESSTACGFSILGAQQCRDCSWNDSFETSLYHFQWHNIVEQEAKLVD